jgi:hypothetical protein
MNIREFFNLVDEKTNEIVCLLSNFWNGILNLDAIWLIFGFVAVVIFITILMLIHWEEN